MLNELLVRWLGVHYDESAAAWAASAEIFQQEAVAGLLGLSNDDKPGQFKQAVKKVPAAQGARKAGKRSAPAEDACDSATQSDSVTLTDGANDPQEREVDSSSKDGAGNASRQRKRQKTGANEVPTKVSAPVNAEALRAPSETDTTTAPSSTPFTLASAAQAAGVWNRAAVRPMIPKMPTMASATEAKPTSRPSNAGYVAPFEGCEAGAVDKDSVEHADALHRESGGDPVSDEHNTTMSAQCDAGLAAFLNENAARTIPSEALQKLLQQCAGEQLSLQDVFRAMQQTSQGANGAAAVDDATHVTHTSTVSTMDVFPTQSADTRATRGTRSQAPLPAAQPPSNPTPALNDADGPQEDPNATATPVATTDEAAAAAPFSAKARSLFVQLSDGFLGPEAAKAALERQATPIVPRSAGPPPHMPLNVGAGPHRTRSSSGAPKAQKPSAQSLTSPLPAYRQQIGHAVPVTSHQKHKSDLLNNPDSRNMLWFPEKSRASKLKGKFLASQKKAADNKQQGLAAERLQGPTDSSGKSQEAEQSPGKEMPELKTEPDKRTQEGQWTTKSLPITPERVEGLLSLVAQLAVFADGGVSGTWCRSLLNADCARARSLFRRALELQAKGTTAGHLAPLLASQVRLNMELARVAALAQAAANTQRHLAAAAPMPTALQSAAAAAAAAAAAVAGGSPADAAAAATAAPTPASSGKASGASPSSPASKASTPLQRASPATTSAH